MNYLNVLYGTFVLWLLLLCSLLSSSYSFDCKPLSRTITVDQSGKGDTTTVQAAINNIPTNNDEWIKIHVEAGIYLERVNITSSQACIILEGEGRDKTIIKWNDHVNTDYSATFMVRAANFVAKLITFVNAYNLHQDYLTNWYTKGASDIVPAEAALIRGDKNAFYQCGFLGYQDTMADQSGRHYFKDCYIEGAVDFIYGGGQSFYENCLINVTGYGFITAQGRISPDDPSGFVFDGCHIIGGGPTYLGRAYRQYSRVIYHSCTIDANVVAQGWDAWQQTGFVNDFEYVESDCKGAQYDTSRRPSWVKTHESSVLVDFTKDAFINQDGWIEKIPE